MEANVSDPAAIKSLTKLITSLEDNDDVQKVYFNCDLDLE
jgi:transcriptional/translational regulatory protein YebC/TACO1